MKKINILLSVLAMTVAVATANTEPSFAQTDKKELRQQQKTLRQQKKELYQKSDKINIKDARKLEKEGWKTMDMPIVKQLEITRERQYQYEADGYPKFVYSTTEATGGSFAAAQMQAENVAKIRIASKIAGTIKTLADVALANNQLTPSQVASLDKALENTKIVVSSKMGRVFTTQSIYKVNKDTYTVRVTVMYDMKQAMKIAQESIKSELKDESDANRKQLEDMLGMGHLIDQYERNNTEE